MEALTGLKFDYQQLNLYSITPDLFGIFRHCRFSRRPLPSAGYGARAGYHTPSMKGQLFLETEHEPEL
jgi:hypothetical protein